MTACRFRVCRCAGGEYVGANGRTAVAWASELLLSVRDRRARQTLRSQVVLLVQGRASGALLRPGDRPRGQIAARPHPQVSDGMPSPSSARRCPGPRVIATAAPAAVADLDIGGVRAVAGAPAQAADRRAARHGRSLRPDE